jgi:hypothetical protein
MEEEAWTEGHSSQFTANHHIVSCDIIGSEGANDSFTGNREEDKHHNMMNNLKTVQAQVAW